MAIEQIIKVATLKGMLHKPFLKDFWTGAVSILVNGMNSEVKLPGFDHGFTHYLGKLRSYLNFIFVFLLS